MARLLGYISVDHVSRLEREKQNPPLETILIYQILFDIEAKDLIPKYYEQLRTTLIKRVQDQPHLFCNKRSLKLIQLRLSKPQITKSNNKRSYEK